VFALLLQQEWLACGGIQQRSSCATSRTDALALVPAEFTQIQPFAGIPVRSSNAIAVFQLPQAENNYAASSAVRNQADISRSARLPAGRLAPASSVRRAVHQSTS